MTVKLPVTTKRAKIVHQFPGPVQHPQLRHAWSDWVLHSEGNGADLAASDDALRRRALRHSYDVDERLTVEDWLSITERMMRS